MKKIRFTFIVAAVILLESFSGIIQIHKDSNNMNDGMEYEVATFGSGCFWHTHNPTTWNRQGNDHGPQYRSVIFYHDPEQQKLAEDSKKQMDISGTFSDPIVTEIKEFSDFYKAEDYHQDYFENNPNQPYCTFIVKPKVEKFSAKYQDKLKQGFIQ